MGGPAGTERDTGRDAWNSVEREKVGRDRETRERERWTEKERMCVSGVKEGEMKCERNGNGLLLKVWECERVKDR